MSPARPRPALIPTAVPPPDLDQPLPLRPLTLVEEDGDVLVGDPAAGTFVAMPPVGAFVIRVLQGGATLGEAAADAEAFAGEPVDVVAFADALRELGFVADPPEPGEPGEPGEPAERSVRPAPTAPIQQRRWVAGVPRRYARPLFHPVAWCLYAAAFLFCVACFAVRPDLWPAPRDVVTPHDNAVALPAALIVSYLLAGLHEAWHWLAARALDLSARFGIDRRQYFVVFETDLSQLLSVPRRHRYGPQLAGLAVDSVVLAALLAATLPAEPGATGTPGPLSRWLATLIYFKVMSMVWQAMIFLRTDLYGVLVTATGCKNLWETKSLLLRRAFGRLSPDRAAELAAAADPRDIQVGRWFRWLYLGGLFAGLGYLGYFVVPGLASVVAWSSHGLSSDPTRPTFWLTAAVSAAIWIPLFGGIGIWLTTTRRRRSARPEIEKNALPSGP